MLNKLNIEALLNRKTLSALIVLWGISDGESLLTSFQTGEPALGWGEIGALFIFGIVAICFLLGIQVLTKNQKGIYYGWHGFLFLSIYTLSSGTAAFAWSLWKNSFGPEALIFVAVSLGMFIGVFLTRGLVAGKTSSFP